MGFRPWLAGPTEHYNRAHEASPSRRGAPPAHGRGRRALTAAVRGGARWVARYEPGVAAELPAIDASLADLVASSAASAPTFPALECLGRTVSYAALAALGDRVAAGLAREGVSAGDRVLVALPECPESVAATLGVLRAGAVARHAPPGDPAAVRAAASGCAAAFAAPSAARQLDPSALRVIAVDPARALPPLVRLLARLGRRGGDPPAARGAAAWTGWLRAAAPPDVVAAPDAPALEAEGVAFSHRNLVAAAAQLRAWLTDAVPGGETWLMLAPIGSALGCACLLGAAAALRARVVLLPGWVPEDVVDALRVHRPTWVVADASATERLVADPGFAWADLRSVRAFLVAGPLPAGVAGGFEEATGTQACTGLTSRRAAGFLTCQPVNGRRVVDALGLPLPGVDVAELPGGRLALRSPTIAGDPDGEAVVIDGLMDADGFVRLVPRSGMRP